MLGIKQYIYLGVGVVAVAALTAGGYKLYQAGYDKATVRCQTNTLKAVEDALDKQAANHLKHLNRAVERARQDRIIETKIEKVYEKVPVVVEKVITERPQCSDLGLDLLHLWNEPIQAGRSGEGDKGSTEAKSKLANPMSATSRGFEF